MIAYKKVMRDFKDFVLTLEIPDTANFALSRHGQFRVDIANVVAAEQLNGAPTPHQEFYSLYDWQFVYRVGQSVTADLTGKGGIHCYSTKEQARAYMLPKKS